MCSALGTGPGRVPRPGDESAQGLGTWEEGLGRTAGHRGPVSMPGPATILGLGSSLRFSHGRGPGFCSHKPRPRVRGEPAQSHTGRRQPLGLLSSQTTPALLGLLGEEGQGEARD